MAGEVMFSDTNGGPTFYSTAKPGVDAQTQCAQEAKQYQGAIDKWLQKDPYHANGFDNLKTKDLTWSTMPLANMDGKTGRQFCIGGPPESK